MALPLIALKVAGAAGTARKVYKVGKTIYHAGNLARKRLTKKEKPKPSYEEIKAVKRVYQTVGKAVESKPNVAMAESVLQAIGTTKLGTSAKKKIRSKRIKAREKREAANKVMKKINKGK